MIKIDRKNYLKKYRDKNRNKFVIAQTKYRKNLRLKCLYHYGGNPPKCNCCGEQEIKFLSIDHINGRRIEEKRKSGTNIYWILLRDKFPTGIQILCHNCNMAKGFYGKCPHQEIK